MDFLLEAKKYTLAFSLLFFTLTASRAQNNATVLLKGTVIDSLTHEGLLAANIVLTETKTKAFYGVAADVNGDFSLSVKPGNYTLTISFAGYLSYQTKLELLPEQTDYSLPVVSLQLNSTFLKTAVVKGEKEEMRLEIDKKVFSVENNAITVGGTAIDVLNQVPTVDVDVDGNVALRGSSDVMIYINGKPTGFSGSDRQAVLQQIPAANIERVEIINNPSSKYDAEGTAGIINIILKSAGKEGWNAAFTGGVGTNNKYNAAATYSFNKGKLKFTSTYGFRYNENWSSGEGARQNFIGDSSFSILQYSYRDRTTLNNTLNGALDYLINKKTTLSFNWLGGLDQRESPEDVDYTFVYPGSQFGYRRNGQEKRGGYNAEIGVMMAHKFNTKGKNLTFIGNVSHSDNIEDVVFTQDPSGNFRQLQNTSKGTKNTLPVLQLDFVNPGKNKSKLEAGLKYTLRSIRDNFYADTLDFAAQQFEIHNGLSNTFLYNEQVSAAYVSYAKELKKIKIAGGIRAENTTINGEQKMGNIPLQYNYTHLFPSLFITRTLKKGHEAQISYSRRISRPGIGSLNPFREQSDPINLRIGNPNLRPELIDAIEGNYFVNHKGNYYTGTVYFRQTNGVIQRLRSVDNEGVATMTYVNLDLSRNIGIEGVIRRKIKKVQTTLNLNLFRNDVNGIAQNTSLSAVNYSWFGKFLASYKLPKDWEIQGSYMYRGRITYVQGIIDPMHGLDLGFKKDVLKKKGTLTFNITDVFNTKEFAIQNAGLNFEGTMVRKWETRIATVNFTYKIGSLNAENEKKVKNRALDSGGDIDF
jgi:iron complex outermembrane receptor protein